MRIRRSLSAMLLLLPLAMAPLTGATKDDDKKVAKKRAQEDALLALRRGEILPLTRILQIAAGHVPGDVIEVEFKGGPVYEIKMLTAAGRVREVKLNARTGALIEIEDEDD